MSLSRRRFLQAGIAAGAGAALDHTVTGAAAGDAMPATAAPALDERIAFDGRHQAGILTPRQARAAIVAFDAIAPSRAELADALTRLSAHARGLTAGRPTLLGAPGGEGPTPDSGILGVRAAPDALTVTVGFGASVFDGRFGLARRRPAGLVPMPAFPDDDLDPAACHGDVLVQLCANTDETVLNALRELMRTTRGALALRWKIDGFLPAPDREPGAGRNLLGFKDGTANPDVGDRALMDRLVWAQPADGHPEWAAGGTFAVVRVIRNRVEFWDRVARSEQELMIGRDKATGAPLGRTRERDDPAYRDDPDGARIPLDSHIRLARPRTAGTEDQRILRRGYNYSRGVDAAGQLDMGLAFVAFNRSIERQFARVQRRLAGEPLVDYVKPTGGGYFFLPAGARDEQDWVGSRLFV